MRGFFEIGIYSPKTVINVGTLWRSAYQLGAQGIFTIGARYQYQSSDTTKAFRHIPLRQYDTIAQLIIPHRTELIAIEQGGIPLSEFKHPERVIYLLGAEDSGLPEEILSQCNSIITLESIRTNSYNVAIAGTVVMYHRQFLQREI